MACTCKELNKEIVMLRGTIDRDLNRIALSDSTNEINILTENIVDNIQKYASKNSERAKA